jgi:2-haloacid dehalogenase
VVVFDVNETAAGAREPFALLATLALHTVLADVPLNLDIAAAVDYVLAGFSNLPIHSDVPAGVRALPATGRRLVTPSNVPTRIAERLLDAAGIGKEFEALLSVEDAGAWKPARAAYEYAARRCATSLGDMLMVAVHPWDIDGAARAGMATAWINRTGGPYPAYFNAPDYTVTALDQLADALHR